MQLAKAMKTPAPLYGTLTEWAVARKRYAANKGGGGGGGKRGGAALDVHLEETKFVVELGSTAEEQQKQAELEAIKVQPEWVTRNQFEKEDQAQEGRKMEETKATAAPADAAVQEQYLQALLSALQKQQEEQPAEEATVKTDIDTIAPEVAAAVDEMDFDEWDDVV
jgi:transcription initiation factor TFIIE subunit alpha